MLAPRKAIEALKTCLGQSMSKSFSTRTPLL